MRAPEQEIDPIDEEEQRTGFIGLAVLVGLLVVLGVTYSWTSVGIVLGIAVIIFLHELGHYLTAKSAGMKVTEFFIGFGPRLWSFRRGETEYGLKAIPAGAYVRIIGMSNLDEVDPADEDRTYRAKPYSRRLSVAVAGSTMHFILAAALLLTVLIGFGELREDNWSLARVNGPAARAGLEAGDRILSIDGRSYETFAAMSEAVQARPGDEVEIVVERDGDTRTFTAELADRNPSTGKDVGYLGVGPAYDLVRDDPLSAIAAVPGRMVSDAGEMFAGLGRLFSPSGVDRYIDTLTDTGPKAAGEPQNVDRPSSVIGIVQVGDQVAQEGIGHLLLLMYVFNLFIGIFNLTPLLPFDGGHVVIATYEKVRELISGRRYRADITKLLPLTYAVVAVLALLFVSTIYLDILDPIDIG